MTTGSLAQGAASVFLRQSGQPSVVRSEEEASAGPRRGACGECLGRCRLSPSLTRQPIPPGVQQAAWGVTWSTTALREVDPCRTAGSTLSGTSCDVPLNGSTWGWGHRRSGLRLRVGVARELEGPRSPRGAAVDCARQGQCAAEGGCRRRTCLAEHPSLPRVSWAVRFGEFQVRPVRLARAWDPDRRCHGLTRTSGATGQRSSTRTDPVKFEVAVPEESTSRYQS